MALLLPLGDPCGEEFEDVVEVLDGEPDGRHPLRTEDSAEELEAARLRSPPLGLLGLSFSSIDNEGIRSISSSPILPTSTSSVSTSESC